MSIFRSRLFSSLQFRLALGFVLALVVALALIGLSAGVVAGRQTERFDRDRDTAQVARLRHFVSEFYAHRNGWDRNASGLQETVERVGGVSGSHIIVFDARGAIVADSHPGLGENGVSRNSPSKRGPLKATKKIPVRFGNDVVGAFTVSAVPAGKPPDFVVADPAAARISSGVNRSLVMAGIGAAALGTLLVWLISRRTLAPLQSLGAAARRLGGGDLSSRAETRGPTEIRELAQFNGSIYRFSGACRQAS